MSSSGLRIVVVILVIGLISAAPTSGQDFIFSRYWGGKRFDQISSIVQKGNGEFIIVGHTFSCGRLPGFRSYPLGSSLKDGHAAVVVANLTRNLRTTRWHSLLGTTTADSSEAGCVALDANENIWISGYTNAAQFPVAGPSLQGGQGTIIEQFAGGARNLFLACLSPKGNLLYSQCLGLGVGWDIAFDADENEIVLFGGAIAPASGSSHPLGATVNGTSDAFVTRIKLDNFPTSLTITSLVMLGGSRGERALRTPPSENEGLAIRANKGSIVTGFTGSEDFPIINEGNVTVRQSGSPVSDAFLGSIASGSLESSVRFGRSHNEDHGTAIATGAGNVLFLGGHSFRLPPALSEPLFNTDDTGVAQGSCLCSANRDCYVVRMTLDGGALGPHVEFIHHFGGFDNEILFAIEWSATCGSVVAVGETYSQNFPRVPLVQRNRKCWCTEGPDAFVMILDGDSLKPERSFRFGGSGNERAFGCIVIKDFPSRRDNPHGWPSSDLVVVGGTDSHDFPVTNRSTLGDAGTPQEIYESGGDAFIAVHRLCVKNPFLLPIFQRASPPQLPNPNETLDTLAPFPGE